MKKSNYNIWVLGLLGVMISLLAGVIALGCKSVVTQANATEVRESKEGKPITQKWPRMVTIPAGTTLKVSLNTTVRSDREMSGDGFIARLHEAVRVDQMTVLPAGTVVYGRLLTVAEPYTTSGKAKVTLSFQRIVDPSGRILPFASMPVAFVGRGNKTEAIGTLAAVTAMKPVTGVSEAGVIIFPTTSQQIELPSNQRFAIRLDKPLRVSVEKETASK